MELGHRSAGLPHHPQRLVRPLSEAAVLWSRTVWAPRMVVEEGGSINDDYRIDYLRQHIAAMRDAVTEDGVDLLGYTTVGPD